MNTSIMKDWFEKVVEPHAASFSEPSKVLLLLDSTPCHNCVAQLGCDTVFVPKGHTGVLQPLDISVMKRFKAVLRHKWMLHVIESVRVSAQPARLHTHFFRHGSPKRPTALRRASLSLGGEKVASFLPQQQSQPRKDLNQTQRTCRTQRTFQ